MNRKASLLVKIFVITIGLLVFVLFAHATLAVSNYPPRGIAGDFWADTVFGQPLFSEGMVNQRTGYKANLPGGVHIDRSVTPNRIYVNDAGNSRILAYNSVGQCSNNSANKCTSDSDCGSRNTCNLIINKPADLVIGQSNVAYGSCNHDANMLSFPNLAKPSASSLCSMIATQISPLEGGSYSSMDTDLVGNLYVADWQNNRVLKYNNPLGTKNPGADEVWGQINFSSALCNQGLSNPTAKTLCLSRVGGTLTDIGITSSAANATAIDPWGNLWVVDVHNHRVLRFPKVNGNISKKANLVLGQPTFATKWGGSQLNRFIFPESVAVDSDGSVYVVDGPKNDRILKFSAPLQNGMNGTVWGSGFQDPVSVRMDPQGQGIWVSDNGNHEVQLWNKAGTQIKKVLMKDVHNGVWPPTAPCTSSVGYCWMIDTRGSIGITTDGDVWVSGSERQQNVLRFKAPISTPNPGVLVQPDYGLLNPPGGHNLQTGRSFFGPSGLVAVDNQLIVADHGRVLFWNNPASAANWKKADGVVGVPDFESLSDWPFTRAVADKKHHMYILHDYVIDVYKTPLKTGDNPITTIPAELKTLENETIDLNANGRLEASGLAVNPSGSQLWVAHPDSNRVVRIRNPLTNPQVDMVLGQSDASKTSCNSYLEMNSIPDDYKKIMLCNPGSVSLDPSGNVYVSDAALEVRGNKRLMIWNSNRLPNNNSQTIYGLPSDKIVLNGAGPLQVAFDSAGHGVVGYNSYQYKAKFNSRHSLNSISYALGFFKITGEFNEYFVMPYSLDFDENDNLYALDLNRFRVLFYKRPFFPDLIESSPGVFLR